MKRRESLQTSTETVAVVVVSRLVVQMARICGVQDETHVREAGKANHRVTLYYMGHLSSSSGRRCAE